MAFKQRTRPHGMCLGGTGWLGNSRFSNHCHSTAMTTSTPGTDMVKGESVLHSPCLMCRYSLRGLPRVYRCPECGYSYVKPISVFNRPVTSWRWLAVLNLVAFVTGVMVVLVRGQYTPLLATGIGFVAAAFRGFSAQRKVIVTPEEVQIVIGPEIRQRIPMPCIRNCIWSVVDGSLRLFDNSGSEICVIPRRFLWSHHKTKKLVEAVNAQTVKHHSKGGVA